jgi:amidase
MTNETGAFCTHAHPERKGRSGGPLDGLVFAVKDIIAVEGVTACYGNPTWLATHAPSPRDARAVSLLLAAGANLDGITLTDEMALSLTGENAHYGTPLNTLAPDRVPGGSSSGSASAVAAGLVDFALGTDTGGSVRVPASHCGIFGIRPSFGAVDTDGVLPLARCFDTVGWFARDAELLARVGAVLLESRASGSGRAVYPFERFLVLEDLRVVTDEPAWTAFLEAASRAAEAAQLPLGTLRLGKRAPGIERWLQLYATLQNDAVLKEHRRFLESKPIFGSLIRRRFDSMQKATFDVAEAEAAQSALRTWLADTFASGACILLPSAPGAAPDR